MKTETANAVLVPVVGPGISFRSRGQRAMEAGIKDGDLGNGREELFDERDAVQSGLIMQRGNRGKIGDGSLHLRRDNYRPGEIGTAMDDTVSDGVNF